MLIVKKLMKESGTMDYRMVMVVCPWKR